jgi:nucleotide-binding universal stress UspA family protein
MEPTVVGAFDPEAGDRAPVELARLAARLVGARLVVAVVHPGGTTPERLARFEERGTRCSLAALAAELRREHAELRAITAPSPASGLHNMLAAELPALAVAGSAERAPHGRVQLGTTTERLLDGAPCPLAIAPRGWAGRPLGEIAVAVLPSAEGRAALRAGAGLARAADVPLTVVMVLGDSPDEAEAEELVRELAADGSRAPATPDRDDGLAAAGDLRPAMHGIAVLPAPHLTGGGARVLRPALARTARRFEPEAWLDVVPDVYVGDPADTLVRVSMRADLLVLGSRAYGSAGEVHAGGVARLLLGGARCPVVIVPRDAGRV